MNGFSLRRGFRRPRVESLECRVVPTTDLIVAFNGGTLTAGNGYLIPSGYSGSHTAFTQFPASGSGGGTVNRTEQILQTIAGIRMDYADFDVRVIWDDRGVNSPFYDGKDTVVYCVGDSNPGLYGIASSVDYSPLQNNRDTALAFGPTHFNLTPNTAYRSIRELTDTMSHEAGHTFGLSHATQADSQQRQIVGTATQNANLDSRFSTQSLNHGAPETGVSYSEVSRLTAALGLAPAGTTIGSNETVTNQTLPQDTTANNFSGTPLSLPGVINFAGDRDAYRITFASAGTFNVRMAADSGSGVDSIFTVWDADGDWIATSGQAPSAGWAKMDITVSAGQTIYVVAGTSYDRALTGVVGTPQLGNYTVTIGPSDGNGTGGSGGGGGGGGGGATATVVVGADYGGPAVVSIFDIDGKPQGQFYAYDRRFLGGVRVARGDVNNDGVLDIITAAGPTGGPHIKVFDGSTGQEIYSFMAFDPIFTGGVYVASGDVDGDGFADIIASAGAGGGPHVKVFSGKDGSVIGSFMAFEPTFRGGVNVAYGDVNNDGAGDIIAGPGVGGGGIARVFNGTDFSLIRTISAFPSTYRGGVWVTSGDLDKDGFADVIMSAASGSTQVMGFSGKTGRMLTNFVAIPNTLPTAVRSPISGDSRYNGGVRVGVVDYDGDGAMEIVCGTTAGVAPRLMIFGGTTGGQIKEFNVFDPTFLGGIFVG